MSSVVFLAFWCTTQAAVKKIYCEAAPSFQAALYISMNDLYLSLKAALGPCDTNGRESNNCIVSYRPEIPNWPVDIVTSFKSQSCRKWCAILNGGSKVMV